MAAPLAHAAGTPVAGPRARLAAGGNVQRKLTVRSRVEIATAGMADGHRHRVAESVLHGLGEELRRCLQVVGAEQDGVLDAHGLAAHRGELRDEVLRGGVARERGQVRGVRLERGDAAAQRLTSDLDAVGRGSGEPGGR